MLMIIMREVILKIKRTFLNKFNSYKEINKQSDLGGGVATDNKHIKRIETKRGRGRGNNIVHVQTIRTRTSSGGGGITQKYSFSIWGKMRRKSRVLWIVWRR